MAMLSAAASPFCRPEEDPFLLLESSLKAIERILLLLRGLPLRRTWIEQPYGEEEITLLEEEVIPAIQQCLARVDELDERLAAQRVLADREHFVLDTGAQQEWERINSRPARNLPGLARLLERPSPFAPPAADQPQA